MPPESGLWQPQAYIRQQFLASATNESEPYLDKAQKTTRLYTDEARYQAETYRQPRLQGLRVKAL